jgi:predicted membrane metal-binding protein
VPRVAFPASRRVGVVVYLVIGSIFLWMWQPDLLSGYVWGMILAAGGVAFLLIWVRRALRMRQLLKSGASAQGTVVGTEKKTDDQETYYHPRVQFTAVDGRTVVFTSAVGFLVEPNVGDPVPVRYHPARPEQAEADSGIAWILPAVLGSLFGLGLLVIGIIALLAE